MTQSLHVHVYFADDAQRAHALSLREVFSQRFPMAELGRVHDRPVAFHPAAMYQVALPKQDLGTLISWLQRHRGDLSVLVHPVTGDVVREHTDDAVWLGTPLALDADRLQRAASGGTRPAPVTSIGPRILRVDASARREGSNGRALADAVVARLSEAMPGAEVVSRDLSSGVPLLDTDALAAWQVPAEERSPSQALAASSSDALIDELKSADAVVLSVPIYNFGVPAALKAWIDQVARARVTFRYSDSGPVGMLADRPVYVVVTSGGTRVGSDIDFVTPWLRHVLGFLGLHDVHWVTADGLAFGAEERLAAAHASVESLAMPLRRSA